MKRTFFKIIFNCLLLLGFIKPAEILAQYADIPWSIPISANMGSVKIDLTFGTHQNATSGYDSGIDEIAAPPGFTPYVYFQIQEFPNLLSSDFRAPDSQTTWNMKIVNTNGLASYLNWDSSQFPVNGFQTQGSLILNDTCNMLQNTMHQFIGDQTLTIVYVPPIITGLPVNSQASVIGILDNNYPNPFNNTTTIQYYVSISGLYNINIYNISGELIDNLMQERKSPGKYQINWNGTNSEGKEVASGIYMILFRSKTFSFTKKIILIK